MSMFKIFFCLFFLANYMFAKKNCNDLLSYYKINYVTKSYKGWMRVCNNDKLELYTNININKDDKDDICNCFYYDYKDRDVVIKDKDKR